MNHTFLHPDVSEYLGNYSTEQILIELDRIECERSFYKFFQGAWKYIDPAPFKDGAPLQAIAEHLQAVAEGQILRLVINEPPRMSKSSMVSVAFCAWVWAREAVSPTSGASVPILTASYAFNLALRDSVKCRRLIESPWYQARWGHRFSLRPDQNTKTRFDNTLGGSRLCTSVGSSLTGEGGNLIIIDDPNAAQEAFSEATIQTTIDWWDNALSTRLNDPKTGAFIVIQQRLAQNDLTGHILSKGSGDWTHLMLPMRYEWSRHSVTCIGWEDPRGLDEDGNSLVWVDEEGTRWARDEDAKKILDEEREGMLLWEERFGEKEVRALEVELGSFGAAGQLQQRPSAKEGGIIRYDWWQPWPHEYYPPFDFIVASLDCAYTEAQENDPSALTVWGVFYSDADKSQISADQHSLIYHEKNSPRKILLAAAWQDRLTLNDLVAKTAKTCRTYKVDLLLIENKASGISVSQEMRRLFGRENWAVRLIDPRTQDKVARLYAVQPLFEAGLIFAPNRSWADMVMDQCATFPKGVHDDLVDTVSQALKFLRNSDFALLEGEHNTLQEEEMMHRGKPPPPLYAV